MNQIGRGPKTRAADLLAVRILFEAQLDSGMRWYLSFYILEGIRAFGATHRFIRVNPTRIYMGSS